MTSLVSSQQGQFDPVPNDQFGPGPSSQAPQSTDLLALAWRGRWLILLGVLIGGTASWVYLQRVTPLFLSQSRIYVERSLPNLLGAEYQVGRSNSYLFTQAELIRSTGVLAAVAESPEAASMETFRGVENRVAMLYEALSVGVGQDDEIINVGLELPNRFEAAQLVNAIVDAYITQYAEKRRNDTVEVLKILRSEQERRDAALAEARQDLTAFREANPELSVQVDNQDVASDRFSRLMNELNQTELEQLTAKAEYERVKQMAASPSLRPMLLDTALDAFGSKSDLDRDLERLRNQAQDLELALMTEQSKWGDEYPTVKSIQRSLDQAEQRIVQKEADIAKSKEMALKAYAFDIKERYEFQTNKLNELRSRYQEQFEEAKESSANSLKLMSLQEAYERAVSQADVVEQRIKELDLTTQAPVNVSIIETASVAPDPSYPSRPKFLGAGVMLGALCGFGIAWLRDMLDHRLKSVDEIQEVLQLQVFGAMKRQMGRLGREELGKLVHLQPRSTSAEAFRTLRTAVHFGLAGDDCKVLVVTSPSPGDGKSVIASNLAIATDQADRRVLLIDADMRKPTQHSIFGVDSKQGLSTMLRERRPVEDFIIPNALGSLDFLPAGPSPSNPLELLNNDYLIEVLERLKARYDRIIIDSPPVMPVADSRVIAAMSDAVLLVLRAEKSTRSLSLAARNELWRVRTQRLGVVVNAVPQSRGSSYGYGYAYGGYGAYGEIAYGHEEDATLSSRKKRLIKSRPAPAESATVVEQT
ncbi:Tyrosine-protein kinase YwqD [Posidoniimonas corsicana]|uniref:non-specific protein-tyrosine kinase n=1 Tax=Posidoniimonas corsicana TaxID=1938618 RepID=A0A5C5VEK8_9BACT|nr:Tyrosine-protein kinase YwqD [Posidoniimonas corsicana]